jgi:hypothetical protein
VKPSPKQPSLTTENSFITLSGIPKTAILASVANDTSLKYSEAPGIDVNTAAILPPVQLSAVERVLPFF